MTEFLQKQGDGVPAVPGTDFRLGFEELVRDHLDGCMSTAFGDEDDDDEASIDSTDQLIRRRRRSDLEGEDLAESSAARRRHSRILSRWVARQAEEMITTIERRNRESELMALSGLHTVSMLMSGFLGDSRMAAPAGNSGEVNDVERPTPSRQSTLLRRWRELEISNSMRNRPREESPEFGEGDGERVRQIVRDWTTERRTPEPTSRISSQREESPRAEWLGETERERVRLVREWVQMASERREARAVRRVERGRLVADREVSPSENVRRGSLGLHGRQARIDLIARIAAERQRELQGLSEHRAVSEFSHRNRIQVRNLSFCLVVYQISLTLTTEKLSRNNDPETSVSSENPLNITERSGSLFLSVLFILFDSTVLSDPVIFCSLF